MSFWRSRDPWPLPKREHEAHLCTMEGHDAPTIMIRRMGNVDGLYGQLYACLLHDGDAADKEKINKRFGRKRCANRECLRRWEHPGDCP